MTSPAATLPSTTTRIGLAIQRKNWTNLGTANVVGLALDLSLDGTVWQELGRVTSATGTVLGRDGNPLLETTMLCRIPRAFRGKTGVQARVRLRALADIEGLIEAILDDAVMPLDSFDELHSVAYDTDGENTATAATSVTISSLVVANNAQRILIVGVGAWDSTNADTVVSTVSWNGSTSGWSQLGTESGGAAGDDRTSLWGLTNPTATTANVVVTMGGTCAEIGANALSAYAVDQSTSFGSTTGARSTAAEVTIKVASSGADLVYAIVYYNYTGTGTGTPGDRQIERADTDVVAGSRFYASTERAIGAETTMSNTIPGTMANWNTIGVAIKSADGPDKPSLNAFLGGWW